MAEPECNLIINAMARPVLTIFAKEMVMNWFIESNRWKHLIGGIGIGLLSDGWWCAALAGLGVSSALELKDKLWGGKWDWTDWSLTVAGVAMGFGLHCLIKCILL